MTSPSGTGSAEGEGVETQEKAGKEKPGSRPTTEEARAARGQEGTAEACGLRKVQGFLVLGETKDDPARTAIQSESYH